jgi:hypothetical protein
MGMKMPETCWAVFKRQAINLRNCCIWLFDSFEIMMMHGVANRIERIKFKEIIYVVDEVYFNYIREHIPSTCIYSTANLCKNKALFNYCLAYRNFGHPHAYTQDYFWPLKVQYKTGCECDVTSVNLRQNLQWVQMFMSNFSKTFIRKFFLGPVNIWDLGWRSG